MGLYSTVYVKTLSTLNAGVYDYIQYILMTHIIYGREQLFFPLPHSSMIASVKEGEMPCNLVYWLACHVLLSPTVSKCGLIVTQIHMFGSTHVHSICENIKVINTIFWRLLRSQVCRVHGYYT